MRPGRVHKDLNRPESPRPGTEVGAQEHPRVCSLWHLLLPVQGASGPLSQASGELLRGDTSERKQVT